MGKKVKLKPKKIEGRIAVLKAMPYEGHMAYIRLIDKDIFEWDVVYNNQLYSSYMVITPSEGTKELTNIQKEAAVSMLWAGATSTIDTLMGKEVKVDDHVKVLAELN